MVNRGGIRNTKTFVTVHVVDQPRARATATQGGPAGWSAPYRHCPGSASSGCRARQSHSRPCTCLCCCQGPAASGQPGREEPGERGGTAGCNGGVCASFGSRRHKPACAAAPSCLPSWPTSGSRHQGGWRSCSRSRRPRRWSAGTRKGMGRGGEQRSGDEKKNGEASQAKAAGGRRRTRVLARPAEDTISYRQPVSQVHEVVVRAVGLLKDTLGRANEARPAHATWGASASVCEGRRWCAAPVPHLREQRH